MTLAGDATQLPAGATTLHNLTVNSEATLSAPASLSLAGNLTVNGGFTHNNGTVTFNGSGTQTLSGSATFYNLTVNNTSADQKVDASGSTLAVSNLLRVQDGVFKSVSDYHHVQIDSGATLELSGDITVSGNWTNSGTTAIDNAQELTIAAWVRLADTPIGSMHFVTLPRDGGERAFLRYRYFSGVKKLEFYMYINGMGSFIEVNHDWQPNTWYHVAGTFDDTNTMRLYLDGTLGDRWTHEGALPSGNGVRLSHQTNSEALDGWLDDVRVYNRALSLTEIQALANGNRPNTSQATTTLGAALDVNGDLTLNSGTLDVSTSNYAINLAGDFIRNGGIFTARQGLVTFDGSGTQTLDTDAITFYNLTVNSGSTLVDAAEFTVNALLTNNGTFQRTRDVNGSSNVSFFNTGSYGGVTLNANGSDLGSTTVKIKGNQDCTTVAGETVKRCFDISPANTSGRNATITFYFADGEPAPRHHAE